MNDYNLIKSDELLTISDYEEMNIENLEEYLARHRALVTSRYDKLQKAYLNNYPILHQKEKDSYKPDNRIVVNFAKYIVDTMNGFFIGIPIKVSSKNEAISNYINLLDKYNDQDDNNAELSKICSTFGKGYELYFVDEEGEIAITYLNPIEGFMVYDESAIQKPRYFINYYYDEDKVLHGELRDGVNILPFTDLGGLQFIDGDSKAHGFCDTPVVEFIENEERMAIFESVYSMINAYNKAISEKANDVDYFADAYLKVLGVLLDDDSLKKIRDNRIINFDEDAEKLIVEFMEKPNADETQENLIDRLETLIFQMSMVANINDENFGTSSGIALKYKLLSMSNLAKAKERKFTSGLNRRYKLIFSNPVNKMKATDWLEIEYKFSQNFPANLLDETTIATQLDGIVSKETQLSTLSLVEDVKTEIDKIKAEEKENASSIIDDRMFDDSISQNETGGNGSAR